MTHSDRLIVPAQFPPKMQCLFVPKRFKIFYGGRNAGRSWGIARFLLIKGYESPIRVLCCRELQKSISESVLKLLADQVKNLGLEEFYDVQTLKIVGRNGTTFAFEGLKNNSQKVKSYEGVNYCWVEEANNVSEASWDYLIPTIIGRRATAEIIISFNPELKKQNTYQRFVLHPPADSFVVHMTCLDNPWTSEATLDLMEKARLADEDKWLNVWMGQTVRTLSGAVYAKEIRAAYGDGRICRVPWVREEPVQTFWDLGKRDFTTIWFVQRVGMQYRMLRYYQARGEHISHFIKYCQAQPYVFGTFWLPHDAKAERLGSRRTIEEVVRNAGYRVQLVPKESAANGLNAARLVFPNCYFDEVECADGIEALESYRYKVIDGGFSSDPVHDEASDGADSFRYFGLAMTGPQRGGLDAILERLRTSRPKPPEGLSASLSWMQQ